VTYGEISTIAGTGSFGYSGDGGPATSARIHSPNAISVDQTGRVFIADTQNFVIRMVNTDGIIKTIAGSGTFGFSGDGGPAKSAQLSGFFGVFVDETGRIFIADTQNSVIRMVNTNGIITIIAGIGGSQGYTGDGGPATSA
jgi:hypothetical protein